MTTKLDPRYTPEQHRAAREARERRLVELGIRPKPERSIYDGDPEGDLIDDLEAQSAELKDIERADALAQAKLRAEGWDGPTH